MHACSVASDSCDHMDCSLPGSSVHGIFQARILEWVAFPPPGDFPDPGIRPASPALAGGFLIEPRGKLGMNMASKVSPKNIYIY